MKYTYVDTLLVQMAEMWNGGRIWARKYRKQEKIQPNKKKYITETIKLKEKNEKHDKIPHKATYTSLTKKGKENWMHGERIEIHIFFFHFNRGVGEPDRRPGC